MRIAYGVHGYGRGHAMRVEGVLPDLLRRHEVLLVGGGEAHALLSRLHPVERIPFLGYAYQGARLSAASTLRENAPLAIDLATHGPITRAVEARLEAFRPDVVISDSEPFTLRAAGRLGIPRIGFDHVGIIAHFRPPTPASAALHLWRDAAFYQALLGRTERAVVSSFYPAPARRPGVRLVPPVLRRRILDAVPREGEHLLVYFNQPHLLGAGLLDALARSRIPAIVYGEREGRQGRVELRRVDPLRFVDDLASCRALLCTGGHQLASEAIHLGKPMLVAPESSAEQQLNAREIERLGAGRAIAHRAIDGAALRTFLAEDDRFRAALRLAPRDGNVRAVATLEAFARELVSPAGRQARAALHQRPAA